MTGHRHLAEPRLVVATHNPGKLAEIADLLAPYGIVTLSVAGLGLAEPEETGATFAENAAIKARAAARSSGLPALADDSGLAVAALDGAPGVHSARWAGEDRDFARAMKAVVRALDERKADNRTAAFVCALALAWPDDHLEVFEGRVEGEIVWPPRGGRGFGYDPIFLPRGHAITFGEMDPAEKHRISHRAQAFRRLVAACLPPAPMDMQGRPAGDGGD